MEGYVVAKAGSRESNLVVLVLTVELSAGAEESCLNRFMAKGLCSSNNQAARGPWFLPIKLK